MKLRFARKKSRKLDIQTAPHPGETTAIRRAAVRDTGVSRHHEGPIEGPLKLPVHHSSIILRGLIM